MSCRYASGASARRTTPFIAGIVGFVVAGGAMLASGMGPGARAQALANHDSDAPVSFSADSFELQDRADRVVIAGKVVVEQAGLRIDAARMTVAYTRAGGTEINRIDATGGVRIAKGGDTAEGSVAIYDLDRRLITLVGNVRLAQGANRLSGGRLLIDLNSGRATIDGQGATRTPDGIVVPGDAGGRVRGTFTVPRRD